MRPLLAVAALLSLLLLPAPAAAQQLAAGAAHGCAELPSGAVKCWGANRYGQLGMGDTQARGDAPGEMGSDLPAVELPGVPLGVVAGAYHSCALLVGGTVACWGSNADGQLGVGDTQARGDAPGEMGSALPTASLGAAATAVVAGAHHSCALLAGGAVACWGANRYGQLGVGDTQARGDAPGEMGTALPRVVLAGPAMALAAGGDHTCALLKTGGVQCWGYNGYGQLGYGDTRARGDQPGELGAALPVLALPGGVADLVAGTDHTCARASTDGSVRCWGRADRGQTGQGVRTPARAPVLVALGQSATALAAGGDRVCAGLVDGTLRCWGSNSFGELGIGSTADQGDDPGEAGAALAPVGLRSAATAVALGASHGCALLDDGGTQCWGSGAAGRLGTGHQANLGDEPQELGQNLPYIDLGAALPVELVGFRAVRDGLRVRLSWETASETNNAGFALEHAAPGTPPVASWARLAFVPGHGTTTERHVYTAITEALGAGRHRFRLVQHDLDGRQSVGPVVEVFVATDGAASLVAAGPEPFRSSTRYVLTVAAPQHVRATLHDALGRTVATVADAMVDADAPLTLLLDGAALPSGPYLLRVVGERFTATRLVTRAR